MTNINFYASIFGQTGYDSHCRQLVNALYKLNPNIHLDTLKPPEWLRYSSTAEVNMMTAQPFLNATSIMINLPPWWQYVLSEKPKHFVGWVVWEGMNIPKYWQNILYISNIDYIICPSNHTLQAIKNTCTTSLNPKLRVIPHGINLDIFKPRTLEKPKNFKFTFIANKGWSYGINDRGGIQWLLKAFCNEFKNEGNVELICKINIAYCAPNWNFTTEMQKIGLNPEDTKNIKFILNNIDFNDLPNLYHQGDVFVSPTMGDAFNLPVLEAMACGLPSIITNFGGQTDYVNDKNGWLIDYELVPVTHDVMYEGNQWAKPNLEHLQQTMRYVYEHREEVKEKGIKALEVAKQLTWQNSAKQLLNLLNELD